MFYEKELQKTNQAEFRVEKVIKKKGDKLYVKMKGHENSFNSCIDKTRYHYIKKWVITQNLVRVETKKLNYIGVIVQQI